MFVWFFCLFLFAMFWVFSQMWSMLLRGQPISVRNVPLQAAAEIARWCNVLVVGPLVQNVTLGISAMSPWGVSIIKRACNDANKLVLSGWTSKVQDLFISALLDHPRSNLVISGSSNNLHKMKTRSLGGRVLWWTTAISILLKNCQLQSIRYVG